MPDLKFTIAELLQIIICAPGLISVILAWNHPKIRTPWVLIIVTHAGLLTYFFFTGQWGLWYYNIGYIIVGSVRLTMAQRIRNRGKRSINSKKQQIKDDSEVGLEEETRTAEV